MNVNNTSFKDKYKFWNLFFFNFKSFYIKLTECECFYNKSVTKIYIIGQKAIKKYVTTRFVWNFSIKIIVIYLQYYHIPVKESFVI